LELLEACWRAVQAGQRVLLCGIYRTAEGLEVRASYSDLEMLQARTVADVATARQLADEWWHGFVFSELAPVAREST
jgi:hypothetical protein